MGHWFSSSPKWDIEKDVPDLEGTVVIVTGGNSGLGFATIQHLLRHGAKIYMGARSEEKAKEAIARLDFGPEKKGTVEWLELDLSDPRKAKEAAERFLQKEKRLDILVNNAAITIAPYAKAHDGIQDVMMVNHVSPFVFTRTLLPLLKETAKDPAADVRIVNVSSGAAGMVPDTIRFRNLEDFNTEYSGTFAPMKRYGQSKLANALMTTELQKQFDAENVPILSLSLHPGTINTEGNLAFAARQNWFLRAIFTWASHHLTPSPAKGAYTQVFAAVSPIVRKEKEKYGGAFLMPPAVVSKPNKAVENKELAGELWNTTEELLKEIGIN
ncbi:hypothetical protein EIP91_009371 [Steccherinum ochraceum]|uniref:NAD-P-binding protein n=1 Tax=Steccherinum ochraceum TaxID=92696 RepID=A0A4R0R1Q4_9APHY|nr:hypothetical protein EIP91_009371 [Steccherinum ochraceum]